MRDEPRKLIAIQFGRKGFVVIAKNSSEKGLPYQLLVTEILASEMRKASLRSHTFEPLCCFLPAALQQLCSRTPAQTR
jgi:hypothetical protein